MTRKVLSALLLLFIGAMLLSGCAGAAHEEIWLYSGDRWKTKFTITFTADELGALNTSGTDVTSQFEEMERSAKENGVSFKWKQEEEEDGSVTYILEVSGKGLDTLRTYVFNDSATLYKDDDGYLNIEWDPSDYAMMFRSYALIIHGGKIASSNADSQTEDTATWRNPGYSSIEIRIKPASNVLTSLLSVLCIGGILLLIVGGGIVFVMKRKSIVKEPSASSMQQPWGQQPPADAGSYSPVRGWRPLDE